MIFWVYISLTLPRRNGGRSIADWDDELSGNGYFVQKQAKIRTFEEGKPKDCVTKRGNVLIKDSDREDEVVMLQVTHVVEIKTLTEKVRKQSYKQPEFPYII